MDRSTFVFSTIHDIVNVIVPSHFLGNCIKFIKNCVGKKMVFSRKVHLSIVFCIKAIF